MVHYVIVDYINNGILGVYSSFEAAVDSLPMYTSEDWDTSFLDVEGNRQWKVFLPDMGDPTIVEILS